MKLYEGNWRTPCYSDSHSLMTTGWQLITMLVYANKKFYNSLAYLLEYLTGKIMKRNHMYNFELRKWIKFETLDNRFSKQRFRIYIID